MKEVIWHRLTGFLSWRGAEGVAVGGREVDSDVTDFKMSRQLSVTASLNKPSPA